MAKADKTLIEYNIRNCVYAIKTSGTYGTPAILGYANGLSLDKNSTSKEVYGDGDLQLTLMSDKGFTGSLELTARDEELETALGLIMTLSNGVAEVQQVDVKDVAIGCEVYLTKADGTTKVKKIWYYGCNISAASTSLSQTTTDINNNNASYGLTIKGVDLMDSTGTAIWTDSNGLGRKCFSNRALPDDTDYETFLTTVPVPKHTA